MDTAQFTCGHCGKLMAVAAADLGRQVQCPHCQQVVEAPAQAEVPPESPADPVFTRPAAQEVESIFAPEDAGEDVFGSAPAPRLELPPAEAAPPAHEAPPPPAAVEAPLAEADGTQTWWESAAGPPPAAQQNGPAEPTVTLPDSPWPAPASEAPAEAPAPVVVHRPARPSHLGAMLLILLIPYAVMVTGALAYMVYLYRNLQQTYKAADPLEQMLDPAPKDGGPRRVQHDLPLPDKLKTALGQPLQIGDLELKPLRVEQSADGELVLLLHMRNLSRNTAFNPFPDKFVQHRRESNTAPKPYTYLQVGVGRIYGGYAQWHKGAPGKDQDFDGVLRPGEEMTARLTTDRKDEALVKMATQAREPLLWRLHVRRGFVAVRGKDVSATAVIGVRFTAQDIAPPPEAKARATAPAQAAFGTAQVELPPAAARL
jgi:hypothetical protein